LRFSSAWLFWRKYAANSSACLVTAGPKSHIPTNAHPHTMGGGRRSLPTETGTYG